MWHQQSVVVITISSIKGIQPDPVSGQERVDLEGNLHGSSYVVCFGIGGDHALSTEVFRDIDLVHLHTHLFSNLFGDLLFPCNQVISHLIDFLLKVFQILRLLLQLIQNFLRRFTFYMRNLFNYLQGLLGHGSIVVGRSLCFRSVCLIICNRPYLVVVNFVYIFIRILFLTAIAVLGTFSFDWRRWHIRCLLLAAAAPDGIAVRWRHSGRFFFDHTCIFSSNAFRLGSRSTRVIHFVRYIFFCGVRRFSFYFAAGDASFSVLAASSSNAL
mmetsp:Transcript_23877/g.68588  ORF Transcript_23877/g.68588 Transcript_23877/m.68588 type:complete len:270 (-) Transcript_23877:89-898(-)